MRPTLHGINADDIDWYWPNVEPLLARALAYSDGKYSLDDIHGYLISRDMQLWLVEKAGVILSATITQIIIYPQKKVLLILLCAGDGMSEWVRLIKLIMAWAKHQGCISAEIQGRPGWEKILPDFGFKKLCAFYSAALEEF